LVLKKNKKKTKNDKNLEKFLSPSVLLFKILFVKRAGPASRYLASVAVIGLFLTEWSAVVDRIPYYKKGN
jgi:hypothetical protein